MKTNFVEIVTAFEEIQQANPKIIRSFYFGDPQYYTIKDMLFPSMLLTPLPGDVILDDPGTLGLRFSLGIIDKLTQDNANLKYVLDDCMNIAMNVITELGEREDFNITNASYEVGYPTFDYLCGGVNVNFTIQVLIANCGKMTDIDLV